VYSSCVARICEVVAICLVILVSAPGCGPTDAAESDLGFGVWVPGAGDGNPGDKAALGESAGSDDGEGGGTLLRVSPAEIDLGSVRQTVSIFVSNGGDGEMVFEVAADVEWVRLDGAQGTSSGDWKKVVVTGDRSGLAPGDYEGQLTVFAAGQVESVALWMTVGGDPGEEEEEEEEEEDPVLHVDKDELDFEWCTKRLSFVLHNAGTGRLNYVIDATVPWAVLSQNAGESTGEADTIHVDVTRENLGPGDYTGSITIETDFDQSHTLTLRMIVLTSAASWGFAQEDSTAALQAAISSGVPRLMIPNMGQPWIVRPIILVSNQEIYIEPGTLVLAKEGEFHGVGHCLFSGVNVQNIVLSGYGAILRMRREDYDGPDYEHSEWRHCLKLEGCRNVQVLGLTLEQAGGDGICVGPAPDGHIPCRDILIRDVTCDENYRQGISVTSAEGVQIQNCVLSNSSGHNPQAGLDLEPNTAQDILRNIAISDCRIEGNTGSGILVNLQYLDGLSQDVSVRFEDCLITDSGEPSIRVKLNGWDPAPGGLLEFVNCTCRHTGLYVHWSEAAVMQLRFADCTWSDVAEGLDPLWLDLPLVAGLTSEGQVELRDCVVYDDLARQFARIRSFGEGGSVLNLVGNVDVFNPHGSCGWTPPDGLIALDVTFHY